MAAPEIRYCRVCGAPMDRRVPPMEDRERAVCSACGYVDYVNPLNVVGTVPVWTDGDGNPQILLCLRNIEPRKGLWTLPAGFHEVGETMQDGAVRETLEEAGARVMLEGLFSVLDVVHVGQVHVFYRARLLDLDLSPGLETIENRMFGIAELPWGDLAFHTVRRTLEHWVADYGAGTFGLHTGAITRPLPRS